MSAPTPAQIENAFAACRSIRFAVKNASRFGGEFSLNDILAADRLAREALSEFVTVKPAAKPLAKRALKTGATAAAKPWSKDSIQKTFTACQSLASRTAKKGGAS